jgi:PTS system mannose-specific IIB component
MIKLFRIDERLIHGQIAIKWSRHTGVDSIVVANDRAAENVMIQKSLKMAAPPGIKTVIKSLDSAIATLNDPRCEPLKVLVLVNSPKDALKLAKNVKGIPFINVGNYGRVAPKKPNMDRARFDNNLYCDPEEVKEFQELMGTGLECIYQTTPEEPAIDLKKLIPVK